MNSLTASSSRFARRLVPPELQRAGIAQAWASGFAMVALLAGDFFTSLATSPPLVDPRWITYVAFVAALVMAALSLGARRAHGRLTFTTRSSLVILGFLLLPLLIFHSFLESPPWIQPDVDEYLDSSPSVRSVKEWDDRTAAWCLLLDEQGPSEVKADRVQQLARALELSFAEGAFVPHETQAAAVDAGAITPEVAAALLTSPRGREGRQVTTLQGARTWLAVLPDEAIGDGHAYAMTVAVHELFPDLEGFEEAVAEAYEWGLPEPGSTSAVSELRNALRLADRLGLPDRATALCARAEAVLRGAWLSDWGFRYRSVGFAKFPEKRRHRADQLETHAGLQLMARCGVPQGIELSELRASLSMVTGDRRFRDEEERQIDARNGRFIDAQWPEAARRRPGVTDVIALALIGCLGLGVWSVRRKAADNSG